ncbi:MAG: hypothetical protein O6705_07985 [Actinobacteria bacterium]|nr:hypothetical protein [Actinomycetota bacterium]MCZ6630762.1 hypothetical protein [Actinomycetota bacterium]
MDVDDTDGLRNDNDLVAARRAWNNGAFIDDCARGVQWSAGQSSDMGTHAHTDEPHRIDH